MTSLVHASGQQQVPAYARLLELVQQAQQQHPLQQQQQQQHSNTTLQDVLVHLLTQLLPPLALPGGSQAAEKTAAACSQGTAGHLQQNAAPSSHNASPAVQQPQQDEHQHHSQQQQQQQEGSPSRKRGHAVACHTDTSSHQHQGQHTMLPTTAHHHQQQQQGQCQEQQQVLQPPGAFSNASPGCLQPPSFLDRYRQQLAAALQAGALCVTSPVTSGTAAGDAASPAPHPGLIYSSAWGPAPVQMQPHAAGGHSGVYRGMVAIPSDRAPQAVVAKVLHLTTCLSHAHTELSALSATTHHDATHVVSLLGLGIDLWSLSPALLLEAGEQTLSERVRAEGPLSEDAARKVVREVLLGLQQLQESGWAHGDVKPGNVVMVCGVAKLADLGSAVPVTTAAAAAAAAAGQEDAERAQSVQSQPHQGEQQAGAAGTCAVSSAPALPTLSPSSTGVSQARPFRGSRMYAAPELLSEAAANTAAAADAEATGVHSCSRPPAAASQASAPAKPGSSSTGGRRRNSKAQHVQSKAAAVGSACTAKSVTAAAAAGGGGGTTAAGAGTAAAAISAQAADVWALGYLLLFLATGRHPRDLPVGQLAAAGGDAGAVQAVLQEYLAAGIGGLATSQQPQQQQQQQQAEEAHSPTQEESPSKRRRVQLRMQLVPMDSHPPDSLGGELMLHLESGAMEASPAGSYASSRGRHRQQPQQKQQAAGAQRRQLQQQQQQQQAGCDVSMTAPAPAASPLVAADRGLLPAPACWLSSSPGALQLATACLQPDPGRRPCVEQLLRLSWFSV